MTADAFDELVENFELFDDWEERYRYVIDIGKQMPEFPDALKTDSTLVEGCVSRVWLDEKITGEGPDAIIEFSGDSDALLDLSAHLSPQRSNGLNSMVGRIRGFAELQV